MNIRKNVTDLSLKKIVKKEKIVFLFVSAIVLFSGCSWQEYFVITNENNSDITIEFTIPSPSGGFGIFDTTPTVYKINSSGNIDWNNQLLLVDLDTTLFAVKLLLPPRSSVIIGNLSNDHYEKHNQQFINDRIFNLEKISITNNGKITEIRPENFDNFFKKTSGNIECKIK